MDEKILTPSPPPSSPSSPSAKSSLLDVNSTTNTQSFSTAAAEAPETIPNPISPEKSLLRRFIPPTLERKHSSGDLQSRLKTRKILGVGETDNGDIHRSKISQVLGHNEHLFMRMPKGYWAWQTFLTIFLGTQAIIIFMFPQAAFEIGFLGNDDVSQNHVTRRYYAAAILGFSFMLWKFLYLQDKTVTRVLQFAAAIWFGTHVFMDLIQIYENGITFIFKTMIVLMLLIRIGICLGCYIFWKKIGSATSGLRKSPSYKDLDE